MLRRYCPLSYKHVLTSDSETESDDNTSSVTAVGLKKGEKRSRIDKENSRSKKGGKGKNLLSVDEANDVAKPIKAKADVDRDALVELAKKYQKFMKQKPIPQARLREAVVVNWQGLAKTLKNLYGQPLHYLTLTLCEKWDQARFGSDDEGKPLEAIFNWSNAESTIWHVEEVHRLFTSPVYLAMLWVRDPEHRAFVDEVIPSP